MLQQITCSNKKCGHLNHSCRHWKSHQHTAWQVWLFTSGGLLHLQALQKSAENMISAWILLQCQFSLSELEQKYIKPYIFLFSLLRAISSCIFHPKTLNIKGVIKGWKLPPGNALIKIIFISKWSVGFTECFDMIFEMIW